MHLAGTFNNMIGDHGIEIFFNASNEQLALNIYGIICDNYTSQEKLHINVYSSEEYKLLFKKNPLMPVEQFYTIKNKLIIVVSDLVDKLNYDELKAYFFQKPEKRQVS